MPDAAYIYDALRTPRGKNRGRALHSVKPVDLVVGLLRRVAARNRDIPPAGEIVTRVVREAREILTRALGRFG